MNRHFAVRVGDWEIAYCWERHAGRIKRENVAMDKLSASWAALFVLFLGTFMSARANDNREGPRSIVSITICSPDSGGAVTLSCGTAYYTERPVIAPGMLTQTINQVSVGTATDEHSTVFPPGDGRGGPDVSILSSASDGNFTACGDNGSRQGCS